MITPRIPSEPISIRSGLGPAPEPGSRLLSHTPCGCDRADRLDHVVHVGELRREVTAGPGRDPPAERRELERLRKAAHGESALAKLVLQHRPGRAGLDARRARYFVHLNDPVERAEVDRDHAGILTGQPRLHPAADAGAAAEGDRRVALVATPREHGLDLSLASRPGDDVGRVGKLAAKSAHDVAVRTSKRMESARVGVVLADLGEGGRRRDAGRRQLHGRERHRLLDLLAAEAQPLLGERAHSFERRAIGLGGLGPPPPVLAPIGQLALPIVPEPGKSFIAPLMSASCTFGAVA